MHLTEAMKVVIQEQKELQNKYTKLAEQETDSLLKAFFNGIVKGSIIREKKMNKKYLKLLTTLNKRT